MILYREEPWMKAAECTSIGTEAFFPEVGEDWQPSKSVCLNVCKVRLQCLDYAMRIEYGQDRKSRWGLYGGLSPQARKKYEPEWLAEQEGDAA